MHPLGENSCKPNDSKRQLINNVETIRGGLHPTVVLTAGAVILLLFPNDNCLPAAKEVVVTVKPKSVQLNPNWDILLLAILIEERTKKKPS